MRTRSIWAAIAAIAVTLMLAIAISRLWNAIGAAEISPAGWLAMGVGIIATLALGSGLMALMFFSSRYGYDDDGEAAERQTSEPRSEGASAADADRSRPDRRHLKMGE